MQEIMEGIFALDGYNPNNPLPPVVPVHPYFIQFLRYVHPKIISRISQRWQYSNNFSDFMRTYNGPVITFQEARRLAQALERQECLRKKDRYVVLTKPKTPEPVDVLSWCDAIEFVKNFPGRPVKLAGGFFFDEPANPGCAGYAKNMFELHGLPVEVVGEMTFRF